MVDWHAKIGRKTVFKPKSGNWQINRKNAFFAALPPREVFQKQPGTLLSGLQKLA
jgi:hypothetical protein